MSGYIVNSPGAASSAQELSYVLAQSGLLGTASLVTTGSLSSTSTATMTDNITTTGYDWPSGTHYLSNEFSADITFDCIGIAAKGWISGGASVTISLSNDGITFVDATTFTGERDAQAKLIYLGTKSARHVRITVVSTGLRVHQLAIGSALILPSTPWTGFNRPSWHRNDSVRGPDPQSNSPTNSMVVARTRKIKAKFGAVPVSFMRTKWAPFIASNHGKPVWLAWDLDNHAGEVIYGKWRHQDPAYTSRLLSELEIELDGVF